jgi:plasmid maintenance system antidote protein VapI
MRSLTGTTALRLDDFFGTGAQFRFNPQSIYDLGVAGRKARKSIKALPGLNPCDASRLPRPDLAG